MNPQTRLIFVEGVPFTGKSTTSEYIATQLNLNGYPAHWVSEGMLLQRHFAHAVSVIDRQQRFSKTVLHAEWSAFVETVRAATTLFVVDSALSYVAVDPFLTEDWPQEAIHAELKRIASLCLPLHPRVIHLVGDVERLAASSIVERGEGWRAHLVQVAEIAPYQQARGRAGLAGAISYLQDCQALMEAILAQGDWPMLRLDVMDQDWAARRRAIMAFLNLDEIPVERPSIARAVLQSYVGTYTTEDAERSDKTLSVRLERDALALYGPDMYYGALEPVSVTRFHLRATPLDIEFGAEEGLAQIFTLFTSAGKAHVYRRA